MFSKILQYFPKSVLFIIIVLILLLNINMNKRLDLQVNTNAVANAEASASATTMWFNMYSANVNTDDVAIKTYSSITDLQRGLMDMPAEAWPVYTIIMKSYLFGFLERYYLIYPEFATTTK